MENKLKAIKSFTKDNIKWIMLFDFWDTSRNQEKMIFGCVPKIIDKKE